MIRNLTRADFNEYYRVRLKGLQEYPVAYSSMPEFFINASQKMHDDLLDDSASDSSFSLKGYFENEKLLGLAGLKPETRQCVDHKASLWGLYVDQDYQRNKIGSKLIHALLIDAIKDKKLRHIRLAASVSCKNAVDLFYKTGFEKYGLERNSIREGSIFHDQVYMQISCV